jgi:serine/threonine protein kinase/WD40 repeat protein
MFSDQERVQAIVAQAREMADPAQRAHLLERLCDGDDALRARVEEILLAQLAAEAFQGDEATNRLTATIDMAPAEATVGAVIAGRYKLLEQIGEGGMGLVWMAEQRSPIRRLVAVKVIKAGLDSRAVLARFEAERQALAMMDHPSIARVLDGGVTERRHPWFAMELVRGLPLTEYCDQRKLPIEDRLQLFMQICSAVQHAHQKGIIHRDLKPSNVLVTEVDGRPAPKIIDFGLAKALGGGTVLTEHTLYTAYGTAAGTPLYMAPEQVAFSALDVDTRADVYALGVMLYELLTGTTPLERQRIKEAAWDEVRRVIREEDPPLPSSRISRSTTLSSLAATRHVEPARLAGLIKGDLDWIVMKALEKDRNRRYESAASFAADVQRHLANEPVMAAPPSVTYRALKMWRKHRGPIAAAALVFGVLLASVIAISGLALRLKDQVSVATAALEQAKTARASAEEARASAEEAKDKALTQSYINSLVAAQSAMGSDNWPEARLRLDAIPAEKRGWEWQFLRAAADAPVFGLPEQAAHSELAPDGRYLLVFKNYGLSYMQDETSTATLVDVPARKTIATYVGRGGDSDYSGWRFTPAGALAADGHAAVQNGKTVDVYFLNDRKFSIDLSHLQGPRRALDLDFSPGGRYLVARVGPDCLIYRVSDGSQVGKASAQSRPMDSLVFSADEESFYDISDGKAARFEPSGRKVREYLRPDDERGATTAAISPDGRILAVGSQDGKAFLFDAATGALIREIAGEFGGVSLIDFDDRGERLLTTTSRNMAVVWSVATGKALAQLRRPARAARFTQDGDNVVGFADGTIWTWRSPDSGGNVDRPTGDANVVAYSADGALAASIDNGRVRIWDTAHRDRGGVAQRIDNAAPSENEMAVTIGSVTCPLPSWGRGLAEAALVMAERPAGAAIAETLVKAPDGRWTAHVGDDGVCEIVDGASKRVATLASHNGPVRALAVTADGERLISAGNDGSIRFWETETWTEIATFRHFSGVTAMAMSPDGTRLAIFHADATVQVWDIREPAEVAAAQRDLLLERRVAEDAARELLAGAGAWATLAQRVFDDGSLAPPRRIAILSELHRQVLESTAGVEDLFERLKTDLKVKEIVEAEAQAMDLNRPQRERLSELLAEWVQSEDEMRMGCQDLAKVHDTPERVLRQAHAIMKRLYDKSPRTGYRLTLGALEMRLGNDEQAVKLIREKNTWVQDEALVYYWNAHSEQMAFLAMAEHRLGHAAEARRALRTTLRFWYGTDPFSPLQREAATLVCPAALDLTPPPHSAAWNAVEAIDAADVAPLRELIGETATIKGRVMRIVPIISGKGVNVILDPVDSGLVVWIRLEPGSDLNWAYATGLEHQEIAVTGEITTMSEGNTAAWAPNHLEIEITSAEQIKIIGDPSQVKHWWDADDAAVAQGAADAAPPSAAAAPVTASP